MVFSGFWLVIRCGGPLRSIMFNVVRCGISSYPSTIVGAIDQIEIIEFLRFQSSLSTCNMPTMDLMMMMMMMTIKKTHLLNSIFNQVKKWSLYVWSADSIITKNNYENKQNTNGRSGRSHVNSSQKRQPSELKKQVADTNSKGNIYTVLRNAS